MGQLKHVSLKPVISKNNSSLTVKGRASTPRGELLVEGLSYGTHEAWEKPWVREAFDVYSTNNVYVCSFPRSYSEFKVIYGGVDLVILSQNYNANIHYLNSNILPLTLYKTLE